MKNSFSYKKPTKKVINITDNLCFILLKSIFIGFCWYMVAEMGLEPKNRAAKRSNA